MIWTRVIYSDDTMIAAGYFAEYFLSLYSRVLVNMCMYSTLMKNLMAMNIKQVMSCTS